jgi:hypothetical protein
LARHRAASALHEVTGELKQLLGVTQSTAAGLAQSAEAARGTAAMIKLTRGQAEHDRRERALMDVEELVEQIFWLAAKPPFSSGVSDLSHSSCHSRPAKVMLQVSRIG